MPIYDTSALQEKVAVVIDIGAVYTKLGFAAEPHPRFIIPTEVASDETSETKKNFLARMQDDGENIFYDKVVEFIQNIFFKHVLVSPKDRKVVIIESVLAPTLVRETLAKVLFRHFEVASVLFTPTHLVALSTLAIDTALVIDMGYTEVVIMPVYSGVQVLNAWQAQPIASEAVHNEIRRQLIESGVNADLLTDTLIEDIKVRTCFVTGKERAAIWRTGESPKEGPCPDVDYPVEGKDIIKISGRLRETVYEVLFPEDNDRLGLPFLILDCILKCPIDMRKKLIENLFVIGGTSMALGLTVRLRDELLLLLESDYYKDRLFLKAVKFHVNPPAKGNFIAWLGGSIYGGTDIVHTKSLTKEQYTKLQHVPDWSNLDDNRAPSN